MIETFTPAVCGSWKRQRIAALLFTVSAVVASAALGALLGLAGAALGARQAVLAAAALALLAAAREAGLVPLPLPQARRQVPERWRFELPLPLWATGYGAGLGAGVFTHQPVSTFWVAGGAAVALARPLPAAVCFSLYGVGRALSLVWPRRRGAEPSAVVELLAGRRRGLLRANAVALVACAALLALAPSAQGVLVAQGFDPAVSGSTLAWAQQDGSVVVRRPGVVRTYGSAGQPSLDGSLLAYGNGGGIRVIRWATGEEVARVDGSVSGPALDWPLLAYVQQDSSWRRLVLHNLRTDARRLISRVPLSTYLGRPSLVRGKLAWHASRRNYSRINLHAIAKRRSRTVTRTRIGMLSNPALNSARILWVDQRSGVAFLKLMLTSGGRPRVIARVRSRDVSYWTTALGRGYAYATRWSLASRAAGVHRIKF